VPGRHQVRVSFDQIEARPSAIGFQLQRVFVDRVVPGCPCVSAGVRCELGVEPDTPQRGCECSPDMAAALATAVAIWLSVGTAEHRTLTVRQIGERDNDARR